MKYAVLLGYKSTELKFITHFFLYSLVQEYLRILSVSITVLFYMATPTKHYHKNGNVLSSNNFTYLGKPGEQFIRHMKEALYFFHM